MRNSFIHHLLPTYVSFDTGGPFETLQNSKLDYIEAADLTRNLIKDLETYRSDQQTKKQNTDFAGKPSPQISFF